MRHVDSPLENQVRAARFRALMKHTPLWAFVGLVLSCGVAAIIYPWVPTQPLMVWLACKILTLCIRPAHAYWFGKYADFSNGNGARVHYGIVLAALALDGLVWGALVWAVSPLNAMPLDQFHVGVTTVGTLLFAAAIRGFTLAIDMKALMALVLAMMLPNVISAMFRHDLLGVAASCFFASLILINVVGSWQVQRRFTTMLRLRFSSERIAQEKTQAMEQARVQGEARTRFLATVSHEMRTPLHGILGLTRVLLQDHPRIEQQQKLALIERSGAHLLTVINDILDFSKIESGRMTLDVRPFDLNSLMVDVVSVFQVLAQRKGLMVTCQTAWQGPHDVMGDAGRVRQIMHNLLGNAVKFTDQGSIHIEVAVEQDGKYKFAVRDTGPGIAPDQMPFIFEPFTQAHSASERRHGGTGLGLSIAREMCRSMDGDLLCQSQLGQGTTFVAMLCLPSKSEQIDSTSLSSMPVAHGVWTDTATFEDSDLTSHVDTNFETPAGKTVLLVEDNPVNVMLAQAMLQNMGCTVIAAADGQMAVDWLKDQHCDVVLMDCNMPVMDGFEATRRIRQSELAEQRSHVPIVAVSASSMNEERETCIQAGMDDFLAKPFSADDLRNSMARAIKSAALIRAA
jgi:two-component system, sensor histidine kinase